MNPILLTIGSFELRWYSILILTGIFLAYFLASKEAKRFKLPKDMIFNMVFWMLIFGFIGARLYYVVFNFHLYNNNLIDILKVWEGGLAIHGGIIAGIVVIFFYSKKYELRLLKLLDLFAIPVLLAQAIGRWGNFFNSEAHGVATTIEHLKSLYIPNFIIKGMNIDGVYFTPTFFYESLWCLLGVLVLLIFRRRRYTKIGQTTALYFIWYSIGRFYIESMRTDSLMFAGFKVAQIISVSLIILGVVIYVIQARKNRFEDLYGDIKEKKTRY